MNSFILVLEKNDEIVSKLLDYCARNNIKSAWISAIGALSSADLALYDLDSKTYHKKTINGPLEIASLSGNIALLDDKIVHHLHIAVSDVEMRAFGGHLDTAIVSATCEIFIQPIASQIIRKHNRDIGLNLIAN